MMMNFLPQPKSIVWKEGSFILDYSARIVLENGEPGAFLYAKMLQKEAEQAAGMRLAVIRGQARKGDICLRIRPGIMGEDADSLKKKQGYRLQVAGGQAVVEAEREEGLLYGVQTLCQIIRQAGCVLPACEAKDWPDYKDRGFYHDATRGRVPTLATLKAMADRLCMYKMNQMQLYIEHTYLFRDFSEVWRDDTPLTAEEIMELDEYCRERKIDLVPSLASFGHLYKVLRTSQYEELCELENSRKEPFSLRGRMLHHTLNAADERSMALSKKMIEEYMALFSSDYFNICADETFDLGKGRSRRLKEEIGLEHVYINYVKELCQFVVDHGKIPMFWGDIICGFPEMIKELPEETICLNWGYSPEQSDEPVKKLAAAGATQYVCSGVNGWNHWIPRYHDAYRNITKMCRYGRENGAIGVLNTDWGDFGQINQQEFSVPGLIYGAAFSWNGEEMAEEEINRRISVLEYQDRSGRLTEIVKEISGKEAVTWKLLCDYREVCEQNPEPEEQEKRLAQYMGEELEIPVDVDVFCRKAERLNEEIAGQMAEIRTVLTQMDSSSRSTASHFLVAADGIRLMNRLAAMVMDRHWKGNRFSREERSALAGQMENWLYYYKEMWRASSKESELFRIQGQICWYADELRRI